MLVSFRNASIGRGTNETIAATTTRKINVSMKNLLCVVCNNIKLPL